MEKYFCCALVAFQFLVPLHNLCDRSGIKDQKARYPGESILSEVDDEQNQNKQMCGEQIGSTSVIAQS
ncbi:MAG: hypothetical protein JWO91_726 [Acidobacteriaceae bacterium]|nr:hypothetical protein [Acidobacteriaceae bacterium]